MNAIRVKRAYEPPASGDGVRILVDRLWPRGLRRQAAHIDHWCKDVAPSAGLRRWFAHDPGKWPRFQASYRAELAVNDALHEVLAIVNQGRRSTLLFGARDSEHNNAVVLRDYLLERC